MRFRFGVFTFLLAVFLVPLSAYGQWQVDGVRLATRGDQQRPAIIPDGAGGAIVAWEDWWWSFNRWYGDVHAQRINKWGVVEWTHGVVVCAATGDQEGPEIVSDGAGGAIVSWRDNLRLGIYAQRINGAGVSQWAADGVALCSTQYPPYRQVIVSDEAGGAIVTWVDPGNGTHTNIYAQRINGAGVVQWTTDGVAFCAAADDQDWPAVVADGAGGAIAAWSDQRSGSHYAVYAQRINGAGAVQWSSDGVLIFPPSVSWTPAIASDGHGGAIVPGTSTNYDIYAQRINSAGMVQWTSDGVALCTAVNSQSVDAITADGAGGAVVAWYDRRNGGTNGDIFAQRIDSAGEVQWATDGVPICSATGDQSVATLLAVDGGGTIMTWLDDRNGPTIDLYAQRVDAAGYTQWTPDGVPLCTAPGYQYFHKIVSDGADGAIVTWQDDRDGFLFDIYAQHVGDLPLSVAISSFDAVSGSGFVTLRSTFRSDIGVEAVNVYRGVNSDENPLTIIERVDNVRGDNFNYMDRAVVPGKTYRYQIGLVDADGEFFSSVVLVSVKTLTRELSQNRPNPFNPTTTIRFVIPAREDVTLAIYDTNGVLVRTLVDEVREYGMYEVMWDGRDAKGAEVGSGVYFYQLRAGKVKESKKMILLK